MRGRLMLMGCMSDVGKSFLVAGLCRLFLQDGYKVAPFKSQNMALNSFVTPDGLEIGRAQAMQAEAAGIPCDVRMNPILLKPTGDKKSQIVLNGSVYAEMGAAEYYRRKREFLPEILDAYHSLENEYEIVIIEGAGSPAEINLRENDIVNMGLAEAVDAPVLLVGDIDRGGVFAQLYGTLALLSDAERARIKGLLINKFRGDVDLLKPGLDELEAMTKKKVYGVLPYMDVELDDEDSLSGRLLVKRHDKPLDIAVIRLPHISNFTDLTPLEKHPLLGVRYVKKALDIGECDCIILPGTKNTMDDLAWLKECGLAQAIISRHAEGTLVIGICGGYQMLGEKLYNPDRSEGERTEQDGLGLLSVRTYFTKEKVLTRREMTIAGGVFNGVKAQGYEVHAAKTYTAQEEKRADSKAHDEEKREAADCPTDAPQNSASVIDCCAKNVYGTYLHGLFDTGEAVKRLAEHLAEKRGSKELLVCAKQTPVPDIHAAKEKAYDAIAAMLRERIDLPAVYRLLE